MDRQPPGHHVEDATVGLEREWEDARLETEVSK